jgi:hypothetical protein
MQTPLIRAFFYWRRGDFARMRKGNMDNFRLSMSWGSSHSFNMDNSPLSMIKRPIALIHISFFATSTKINDKAKAAPFFRGSPCLI